MNKDDLYLESWLGSGEVNEGEFLAGVIGVRAQLDEGVPVWEVGEVLGLNLQKID